MKNPEVPNNAVAAIAVVGMAGRFPGARNVDQFWRNLRDGIESVKTFTDSELTAAGVGRQLLQNSNYVKSGVVLDDLEGFDARFFGFNPKDAAIMDPQHRHFLECAWEALEHAGHPPETFGGSIGVYAGCGMNSYFMFNLLTNRPLMDSVGLFLARHTGNDKDFLATRVSYSLNLKGPSVAVQTACSSSLVAVHMACQSLLASECDMALAGGVTIELPHGRGYLYQEGEILSHDGHCRPFDAASTGTIFGSGVGIVVLRRLEDALADGDCIHAVIRGSAINNDGSLKVGYLAPSVDGQADVIAEALSVADINPDTISYVETHGTGTPVGDPIEIAALTQAFRRGTPKNAFCAIGSLKSNIGHLDTAAGVAGLMKTVLALEHGLIPPSLNYTGANALIDFANSPFFVNAQPSPWTTNGTPRRAGVSSLGVGGTNCHVILEEARAQGSSDPAKPWQLLVLSARSEAALEKTTENLAEYIAEHPGLDLADAAHTMQVGRRAFPHRRIVACRDLQDAHLALSERNPKRVHTQVAPAKPPSVVFLFPGGGAQYPNMGVELYRDCSTYRETVDTCLMLLRRHLDADLRSVMYPPEDRIADAAVALERPSLALPALFITEYALAKQWISTGVVPSAMAGHSMGEYTAACLAGVMSLDDALMLVTLRGRLFEQVPEGAMLSVPISEGDLRQMLPAGVSIAAVNGPSLCVASGRSAEIARLQAQLAAKDVDSQRLKISVAAHSEMLDGILDAFARTTARLKLSEPSIPYISNVTGTWVKPEEAQDPQYWVTHLRQTVRFAEGLDELLKEPQRILLEVGPGHTLSSLAKQHPAKGSQHSVLASLRHPQETISDLQFFLTTCGRVWLGGGAIDFPALHEGSSRRRVPLPTYPFEHERYWIDAGKTNAGETSAAALTRSDDISDWFYRPAWMRLDLPAGLNLDPPTSEGSCWLVLTDALGLGTRVADHLRSRSQSVVTVAEGDAFLRRGLDEYVIRTGERADYDALFQQLIADGKHPSCIAHLWAVSPKTSRRRHLDRLDRTQDRCFYSLLFLAQAMSSYEVTGPLDLVVVSNNVHQVHNELVHPEKATLLGPCAVIPREFPRIRCRNIDIALGPRRPGRLQQQAVALVEHLLREIAQKSAEPVVAYRENLRWVQRYEPVGLPSVPVPSDRLRSAGVYLITGGLGGLALAHAEYLAKSFRAKLVLVARMAWPAREAWDGWLAEHADDDPISDKIKRVRALEAAGAEVLVCAADVTKIDEMRTVVAAAQNRFGVIHGVIHAAGTMDDGIIPLKTREIVERVLAPKVRGTLVLEAALKGIPLDFFVVFSSTSSILGPVGQVDYVAANAFLNAFARSRSNDGRTFTVAIDWGVWSEVGMAVAAARRLGHQAPSGPVILDAAEVPHPLLRHRVARSSDEIVYETEYSAGSHWVLNEHRLQNGAALVPGTAYLEIARAALAGDSSHAAVVIRDVSFTQPLQLGDDEHRRVRVSLKQQNEGYAFSISSLVAGSEPASSEWHEHAVGMVSHSTSGRAPTLDINDIRARCRVIAASNGTPVRLQERHLRFGPRWQNFVSLHLGTAEGMAQLELPDEFAGDLNEYALHPAMLDMATGFPLLLIDGYDPADLYVPLSYQAVRVWKPLPQRFFSYARAVTAAHREAATFDVILMDENGSALVEIEQLVVRRVADPAQLLATTRSAAANAKQPSPSASSATPLPELLQLALDAGITPAEGVEAFSRILAHGAGPQVVASSLDLHALARRVAAASESEGTELPKQSRPTTLRDSYVAPRTDLERQMAAVWQEILGVNQVGIRDNFFDLGGHSLLAVRLFSKLKKTAGRTLPLATLFDAPTIEQLAGLLGNSDAPKKFSSIVPIQPNGSKPPFFCIHGMGGNIVEYSHLARYLSPDQPFYGVQARGLDGEDPPLTRIEDFAAHYISEIRALQPEGPYYFGGSSLGGLVGYEIAQQLHARGQRVALLAFFDSYGRDYPKRLPSVTKLREWINSSTLRFELHWSNLRLATSRQKVEYIQDKAIRLGRRLWRRSMKALDRLDRQIRMLFLPRVLREQFRLTGEDSRAVGRINIPRAIRDVQVGISQAARQYTLRPYLGAVTLFRATNQPPDIYPDHTNGWGELVLGSLEIHDVLGHHGAIVREPRVRALAEKLNACLAAAQNAEAAAHRSMRPSTDEPRTPSDPGDPSIDVAFEVVTADLTGVAAGAGSATIAPPQ